MNDLPHSRQHAFRLGVIKPQNGHIRCDRISGGLSAATSLPKKSLMEASCLPIGTRNGSIDSPSRSLRTTSEERLAHLQTANNDRPRPMILCKIAHITQDFSGSVGQSAQAKSEQFRPAIVKGLSDHHYRDEHLFSLFSAHHEPVRAACYRCGLTLPKGGQYES